MRVVMFTGDQLRHRFAASKLGQGTNLVGVVSEVRPWPVAQPEQLLKGDQIVISRHFAERDDVERRVLGRVGSFSQTEVLSVAAGGVNTPEVFEWVQRRDPEVVVLYGTSIIKPPLLDFYSGRMINVHLGLSPYYRGAGRNFWPLVSRQPECVGATIHLARAKVDAGPILAQIRPVAEISDRAHELGTKTIIAAFEIMPRVLSVHAGDKNAGQAQDLSLGRVFRTRDFNADAVRTMWRHFATGMIDDYLAEIGPRCQRYPIVEFPGPAPVEQRSRPIHLGPHE